MSTWGNSRGHAGLIENRENYSQVTFKAIEEVGARSRRGHLEEVLSAAKVRMPGRKADYLARNFAKIHRLGGLAEARRVALDLEGRDTKIRFLRQFDGIGEKYSRDCWMTIKDPDFEDCVALDVRVQRVEKLLGGGWGSYSERERILVAIAHEAELTGWEFDRVLYHHSAWVVNAIEQGK